MALQLGGFFRAFDEDEDDVPAAPPLLDGVPLVWKTMLTGGLSGLGICPGSMREVFRRIPLEE